jgi:hypothetical protein
MSDAPILNDLRKAKEGEYFHKREQQLIEKMRQRVLQEQERQDLAEFFFVEDTAILDDLQELGYSRETIFLLFLVPVIHVSWIDGSVTEKEREALIEIARERGMEKGSRGESMLLDWLNNRPSDEFFEKTLRLIRQILRTRPKPVRLIRENTLAHYCNVVANASGGILGFGKVSAAQQELIEKITSESQQIHPTATARVIREVEAILDNAES